MTTSKQKSETAEGMNIGNFGTFKSPDGNIERIANTAAEAVSFRFDGWQQTKDATSDPNNPSA